MTEQDPKERARIRHLRRAMNEADQLSEELDLPREIRETATILYRRLRQGGHLPGRAVEEVIAAAIHLACKMENLPRDADEIAEYSDYDKIDILRTSKYINETLDLEIKPFDPRPYIKRYCEKLDLSVEIEEKAEELVELAIKEGLIAGKSPSAVAAGAVYGAGLISTKDGVTQKEVKEVADVSAVTIRDRYQEQIEAYTDTEFNE